MDEDIVVNVMNEPPVIDIGELRIIEIGDEDVDYVLTIRVDDYDGLNWVKVKLGILAFSWSIQYLVHNDIKWRWHLFQRNHCQDIYRSWDT